MNFQKFIYDFLKFNELKSGEMPIKTDEKAQK